MKHAACPAAHLSVLLAALCLCGCVQIDSVTVYPSKYHLMEDSQPRLFQVVEVWSHSAIIVGAGRQDIVLVEHAPRPNDWWQGRLLRDHTAEERRLDNLWDRIGSCPGAVKTDGANVNVSWIVSNEPLVIAIGSDQIPLHHIMSLNAPVTSRKGVQLISDASFNQLATGMVLIDHKSPRFLQLEHPTSLGELLDGRKWKELVGKLKVAELAPPDLSSPAATYRSYLLAIKADDERTAKACGWISDNDRSGALDVIVGLHAAHHRCAGLLKAQFGEAAQAYIEDISQFTDETVDRELKQLPQARVEIKGETATVTLPDYPHHFRKVGGVWKLDFNAWTGLKDPADFFEHGSWGPQFALVVRVIRELNAALERGEYKTFQDFKAAAESKKSLLEASKAVDK